MADSNPQIAACQPKLRSANAPDHFDYGGGAGGYIDALGYAFVGGGSSTAASATRGHIRRVRYRSFGLAARPSFSASPPPAKLVFFDPEYFMHFEEIDLCWRLQLAGYQIRAVPQSVVFHHSGFSQPPATFRKDVFQPPQQPHHAVQKRETATPAVAAALAPVVRSVGRALLPPPRPVDQRPSPLCRLALVPRASAQHLSPPPEPSHPRHIRRARRRLRGQHPLPVLCSPRPARLRARAEPGATR